MTSDVPGFLRHAEEQRSTARVVAEMLRFLGRTFELDRVSFFLAEEDGRLRPFASEYASGATDREMFEQWQQLDLATMDLGRRVLEGEDLIQLERPDDPGGMPTEIVDRFAMRDSALVALALRSGDHLDGVLVLEVPPHMATLRASEAATMVTHLALALENARAFERERIKSAEAEALLEVSNVLARTTKLSAVLAAVAQNAAKVSGFERCSIFLIDEATNRIVPTMSQFADGHVEPDTWEQFRSTDAELPIMWEVLRSGEPAAFEHPEAHPDLIPPVWFEPYGVTTVAYLPLSAWGERFGVLEVDHRSRATITPRQMRIAQAVAAQGAVAIAVSRLLAREQQAVRDLESASRAKDDFLSMLSHELRTPITNVQGLAETLDVHDERLDPEQRRHILDRIRAATERAGRMLDDLLDTGRMVRGEVEVQASDVDLRNLIIDVVAGQQLQGETQVLAEPAHRAVADPHHIRQIVDNLLANAAKYGRPPFVITSSRHDGRVTVTVRDHGEGLPADLVQTAFEPFTQARPHATGSSSGVGLGLSIAQRLAHANGGDLRYEPAPDGGAAFLLDLPASLLPARHGPAG